ncbi:MAG: DUF1643 domain-containing protein [Lactobacillus sp.]|jgi:hypothetical protein|nr:MAG: DUF1643 domain-containing protein [Lactobacillus sp.]
MKGTNIMKEKYKYPEDIQISFPIEKDNFSQQNNDEIRYILSIIFSKWQSSSNTRTLIVLLKNPSNARANIEYSDRTTNKLIRLINRLNEEHSQNVVYKKLVLLNTCPVRTNHIRKLTKDKFESVTFHQKNKKYGIQTTNLQCFKSVLKSNTRTDFLIATGDLNSVPCKYIRELMKKSYQDILELISQQTNSGLFALQLGNDNLLLSSDYTKHPLASYKGYDHITLSPIKLRQQWIVKK